LIRPLLVRRAPPATSESGRNASGQEAFGRKTKEALMEQSPAVSIANVMSLAVGAGATMVSVTEKVGISATPPIRGEQDGLCMADPRPTQDPQVAKAGGARVEDDIHRCLYVTTDRRDIDEFKEVSRTIGRVCFSPSSQVHVVSAGLRSIFFASFGSRLPIELTLG
jgi:hypothetical protein